MKMSNYVLHQVYRFLRAGLLGCLLYGVQAYAALPIQHWVTENGARVFFVETHAIPVLDISVEFDAGSRRDPAGKAGLAALTNGSLDKGIARSGVEDVTEAQILDTFADSGAICSNKTSMDRAGYALRVMSGPEESGAAIRMMAQLLANPSFPEALLVRDKARVIASLREEMTRPESIAAKAFRKDIYPAHPYGESSTPESVEQITRDDLVDFHKRHYVANRAVISLVGDIDIERARRIAQEISSGLGVSDQELPVLPDVTLSTGKTHAIAHPATQAHILIGMPSLKRGDPDFFALTVGNYILGGGGFSSRLMAEVREKRGLSYSVYSKFQPMLQPGPFVIGLQTEKKQAADAIGVVNATLNDFLRKGPDEAELQAARDHLVNSFAMQMDNNLKVLELIAMIGYYRLPLDYLDHWTEKVAQVTAADVKDAMNRRLDVGKMATVIVGQ